MKIFISHSIKDKTLIKTIKQMLEPYGITLFIAEHYYDLQRNVTRKIELMIEKCDVSLIILTKNGFDSNFVQQEIGYIKKAKKPILQLVEIGLQNKLTGFNFGLDMIVFNPNAPMPELIKTRNILLGYWKQKTERQKQTAKTGLGILASLFLLGVITNNE